MPEGKSKVKFNDQIKINNGKEVFQVLVTQVNSNFIVGRVDDFLLHPSVGYNCGSIIRFHNNHVINK